MISANGKRLEELVYFIEAALSSHECEVIKNDRVIDEDGNQLAEFDVLIKIPYRNTTFTWLIECRDRPSQGAAPGAWIDQLCGRKSRFNFDRVTAVSTSGFSPSAIDSAKKFNIELRELVEIDEHNIKDWIKLSHIKQISLVHKLVQCRMLISKESSFDQRQFIESLLKTIDNNSKILESTLNGQHKSIIMAFYDAVSAQGDLFDELMPDEESRKIFIDARYTDDNDHYIVNSPFGPIRIYAIMFHGELSLKTKIIPITSINEYQDHQAPISQSVEFAAIEFMGIQGSIEFRHIKETGETHVLFHCTERKS